MTERLDVAEQWRVRLKDILAETRGKLESSANLASKVATNVVDVLAVFDSTSSQSRKMFTYLEETVRKVELVSEAAKFYKLKSERQGRIAKDWLSSEDCGAFMAKLSGEMINNGIQLEAEAHRLAAVELGVDPKKLASLAQ